MSDHVNIRGQRWFHGTLVAIFVVLVVLVVLAVVLHDSAPWLGAAAGMYAGVAVLIVLQDRPRRRKQ